jgi:type IV pilus assembly protein PilX
MKTMKRKPSRCHTGAQRQRGAVLVVAMIVLVALGLASLALLRSVDILGLISGNLSLQRSALSATDVGVNAGSANLAGLVSRLASSNESCYSAQMLPSDGRGIPNVLKNDSAFAADGDYENCTVSTDTGETAYYIVDRQCANEAQIASLKTCNLAVVVPAGSDVRGSGSPRVRPTYRVTVRVDSVKNTQSYSQVILY